MSIQTRDFTTRLIQRTIFINKFTVRQSVTADSGIPEQQRYIDKTLELEAYQLQQQYKPVPAGPPESTSPPVFKSPIKDQCNIKEGAFAHFEGRLEPLNDPTMKVTWLKDGKPVEASEYLYVAHIVLIKKARKFKKLIPRFI